jgi:PAS domain S-box-containing protein
MSKKLSHGRKSTAGQNGKRECNNGSAELSTESALDVSESEASLFELAAKFLGKRHSHSEAFVVPTRSESTPGEDELPSAADRFRVLVEQIPAVVFMVFLDGGLSEAYVSPYIERTLGFSQEEWLDDPLRWYGQIHPEDKQRWSIDAANLVMSGEPLRATYRVLARDGKVVWFRCEAKLVRRTNGEPWFVNGVGFDVTELKETEIALQQETAERVRLQQLELERQLAKAEQTESRLAAIVESSDDAIMGKTLEGVITNWNAAATRLFGYEPEEIIGKSMLLLIPPELYQEEQAILRKIRSGGRIANQETHRVTKNGVHLDVSLTISPIKIGGKVIGASTIARDITERKRAQEALRESEDRFRTMAETAADAIFRIDEQSTILFANRAVEKIFGYTTPEVIGQKLTMLMPEYLREVHRSAVERYVRTGSRHVEWGHLEVTGLHKDGREIALELSLGESVRDGRHLFTGFVRDVTERKQIDEKLRLTEKLAATGRLAATIAHEINNPLEAVTNIMYLVKKDPSLSDRVRNYLEIGDAELQRVSHLVRQTLGFYRDRTAPVEIDVAALLNDVIVLYERKLEQKKLRIEKHFEPGCNIQALQGEIRQVFSNILANAIEASPAGGAITIRIRNRKNPKDQTSSGVRVSIADSGAGIPRDVVRKIFQPFFTTKENVGTGLGLWVSKSLVEKHGGSIRFKNRLIGTGGTVFSVFLPCSARAASLVSAA